MAEKKEILLDIKVGVTQAVKDIADLNRKLSDLRVEQTKIEMQMQGADYGTAKYKELQEQLVAVKQAQTAYKKEITEIQRGVQNEIIAQSNKYSDTLKGLCAQLSVAKDRLRATKGASGELSDEYVKQLQEVNQLNEKIKTLEQAYGVYTRNVGNYKSGVQELNEQLRQHLQKLNSLPQGSKEWEKESQEIKKVTGQIEELNKEQEQTGQGTDNLLSKFRNLKVESVAAFAVIGAAIKTVKGIFDDLRERTQSVGDYFKFEIQGWKAAYNQLVNQMITGEGWNNLVENMKAAYEQGKLLARVLDEIFERDNSLRIMEADYSAEIEHNKVVARNMSLPYEERLAAANKVLDKERELANMRLDVAKQEEQANRQLLELKTGMNDEEIKLYINQYNQNREAIKQAQDYVKLYDDLQGKIASATQVRDFAARERYEKQIEQQRALMSDEAKSLVDIVRKYNLSNDEIVKQYVDSYVKMQSVEAQFERATARTQVQRDRALKELMTEQANAETKGNKDDYQDELKRLENRKKIDAAIMQYQKAYEYDSALSQEQNEELKYQHEQDWAKRNFELQQGYEREKLRLQQQYSQITAQDYADGLAVLESESKYFYAEQQREQTDHIRRVMENIATAMVEADPTQAAIDKIKGSYAALYDELEQMVRGGMMSYEEYTYYVVQLKQREADEVTKIEKDAQDKRKAEEEKALNEQMRMRQERLKEDLQLAWDNSEQQFKIRKRYIEEEMALATTSAQRRAELEQQLTELMKAETEKRLNAVMEYVNQIGELFSSINQIAANQSQARTQQYEEQNEQEKAALDKRLKAGLLSQRQYDDKVAKLDKELADKKAEETRKQAEREKALAVFQIAINTAQAVMKIWAEVPKMDFGVSTAALTAVAIALGAVQAAAVMSQPLPKARRGGRIEGAKHEQGGVLVETEGEERIVAARPAKAFPELLNLISYIGKNAGVPDTGYALRRAEAERAAVSGGGATSVNIDYDRLGDVIAQRVGEEIKNLQIWLSLAELRDAEQQQVHIESLAKQ